MVIKRGHKKRFLDGDKQDWLVVMYNISVFGMGYMNKTVWYCG
jgi:hypothetical protein